MPSIPTLDLRDLDDPTKAPVFRTQLRAATHDVGFFHLVGTGITRDLEERILGAARRFFALPEEEKREIENIKSPYFSGYTRLGGERTQGKSDHREMLDIWPERTPLTPEQLATKPPYYRLVGRNQWPASVPDLKPIVEEWQAAVTTAAHKLLRAWASSLGAEEDFFDKHFSDPASRLKMIRYPGVSPEERQAAQGVGAHKDGGCLTMLWIEPGVGGLQIQPHPDEDGNGEWIDAPNPGLEGGFICNIGEMVELATQGYLKATVHRVIPPLAPNERISIPVFINPDLDAHFPTLEIPEELGGAGRIRGGKSKVNGVTRDPTNVIHEVYGDNLLKSRLRAHPDVAAIHHADLVASGRY